MKSFSSSGVEILGEVVVISEVGRVAVSVISVYRRSLDFFLAPFSEIVTVNFMRRGLRPQIDIQMFDIYDTRCTQFSYKV